MERYLHTDWSPSSVSFDTGQFSEVELLGTVTQYLKQGLSFWNRIGPGGSITAKVVVHQGNVLFGACDKNFYCLTPEGTERWRFRTEGLIQEGCAVGGNGVAYVGSTDGSLYAVDISTGEQVWRFKTRGQVSEVPAIHRGRVYIGSEDKNFYCLDAATGKEIWRRPFREPNACAPLIVNDRIYIGYAENAVYCLTLDGRVLWRFPTKGMVCSWPAAFFDNAIIVGCWDKNVYCLDAQTGKLRWKVGMTGAPMSPTVWKGRAYIGCSDNTAHCLDAKSGKLLWTFRMNDSGASYFPVLDGICYAPSLDKSVYALDARTGKELWRFKTSGMIMQATAFDGRVYAGSWDCNLYCLEAKTGALIWKFRTSIATPSRIEPPETSFITTAQLAIAQEGEKEEDRYKSQVTGQAGSSQYVIKSDYIVEHKYTKSRKIKSMTSGWED